MEYAGLDVSKESIVVVWKDLEGNTTRKGTYPNSPDGLEGLAALLAGCKATVESSTAGLYVHECLSKRGIPIVMANPARIRLISESDKKTDNNDAEVLANLLRTNMLPTCYVPPAPVRKQRDLIRERKYLVQTNVAFKSRIRAALAANGLNCPYTNILGDDAQGWLETVETLPHVKEHIMQLLRLGNSFIAEIRVLDTLIELEYGRMDEAYLLDTIPGIAKNSAVTIMSEIGDIHRFDSHKKLCSYAGLVPVVHQSGNVLYSGHAKHGNKMLKTTLVENASVAVMRPGRFRKFYQKIKKRKGHQKAILAVAHKMLTIIWFMLQRKKPFEGAVICHKRRVA